MQICGPEAANQSKAKRELRALRLNPEWQGAGEFGAKGQAEVKTTVGLGQVATPLKNQSYLAGQRTSLYGCQLSQVVCPHVREFPTARRLHICSRTLGT